MDVKFKLIHKTCVVLITVAYLLRLRMTSLRDILRSLTPTRGHCRVSQPEGARHQIIECDGYAGLPKSDGDSAISFLERSADLLQSTVDQSVQ